MTFHLPTFVLILFVMMTNKYNGYISNLSPSASVSTWISAICFVCIMKTGFGCGGIFVVLSLTVDRHGVSRSLLLSHEIALGRLSLRFNFLSFRL
jgi:hypothetical protein